MQRHLTASFVLFASCASLAHAHPYNPDQQDLPQYVHLSGVESRTEGVVQTYNIPITHWPDTITVTLKGGDGGQASATGAGLPEDTESAYGGSGAITVATFAVHPTDANALRPGGELRIVVGNKGRDNSRNADAGAGGGGGTALLYRLPTKNANWIELMVAGGGGGAAASSEGGTDFARSGGKAVTTTAGGDGVNNPGSGGIFGTGGDGQSNGAGGGAGIASDGGGTSQSLNGTPPGGVQGRGDDYLGGNGGRRNGGGSDGGFGYGGGGAGYADGSTTPPVGGGGGGYSGGGSGANNYGGGGGGCYIFTEFTESRLIIQGSSRSEVGTATVQWQANTENTGLAGPTITIEGNNPVTFNSGGSYSDAGAKAQDVYGNFITESTTVNTVQSDTPGTYTVTYSFEDQFGNTSTATRTVTVLPNKPTFEISGDITVDEDSGAYTQENFAFNFNANDAGQTLDHYLIYSSFPDTFAVQPAIDNNGTLTFTLAENQRGDIILYVTAIDDPNDPTNGKSSTLTCNLNVTSLPDPPTNLTLDNTSVDEAQLLVGTVSATEPFGWNITYSVSGGADRNRFSIDPSTRQLFLNTAPDFENPNDANLDSVYEIEITATGLDGSSTISVSIAVNDLSEEPVDFILNTNTAAENQTGIGFASATDEFGGTVAFQINGGADAALFAIDEITGELAFLQAPDFESPGDQDSDNRYQLDLTAIGSQGQTTSAFEVIVTNVNEALQPPVIDTLSVNENTKAIGTVSATDPDGDTLTYSLAGGTDASRFSINSSTGALSFKSNQNFESPSDANKDGIYEVAVLANDGSLDSPAATFTITLLDVQEAPENPGIIAFTTPEGQTYAGEIEVEDPEGDPVSYAISGGSDAALFTIDATTGQLEFLTPPDFENPQDSNANNGYLVTVTASDGELSTDLSVFVEVNDLPEAPTAILLNGQDVDSVTVPENASSGTLVAELSAQDEDASNEHTWELTDDAGGLFTLDGVFLKVAEGAAFDFEALDRYTVGIKVSDLQAGSLTETFTIRIGDVAEPAIEEFRSRHGLNPDGSDDFLDWSNNGIPNLLYLAFGLGDPNDPNIDRSRLSSVALGEGETIDFSYVRPIANDSGLEFTVLTSGDLSAWQSVDDAGLDYLPVSEQSEDLGDGYQRVTRTYSVVAGESARFYQLGVSESGGL